MAAKQKGRQKHIPQRTCVSCGTTDAKRALTRLVRTPDLGVQIDPTGKHAGRGAYLCSDPACWHKAIHTEVLARALRTSLSTEDRERLAAAMPSGLDDDKAGNM